jgi:hypothetical protein
MSAESYVGQAVLVVVLVLESGRVEYWSIGVLEYCALSELHPRSGLKVLVRRFVLKSGHAE